MGITDTLLQIGKLQKLPTDFLNPAQRGEFKVIAVDLGGQGRAFPSGALVSVITGFKAFYLGFDDGVKAKFSGLISHAQNGFAAVVAVQNFYAFGVALQNSYVTRVGFG